MHISTISPPTQPLLKPYSSQVQQHFNTNKPRCRWRQNCTTVIRCCSKKPTESVRTENYYDLLGISVDSNPKAIKEAYRKLQKKHHPDIAGKKGHEYTLMLNQAYHVLMRENLRKDYDASIGKMRGEFVREFTGFGYSSWNGPMRPQALFVDETACVGNFSAYKHLCAQEMVDIHVHEFCWTFTSGCRECVHHADNTFMMDEAVGCARVKVQYGDDGQDIEVAVESCPVNCIHWVDKEELAVLEFLVRPRPKEAYGMFGGGWDRPSNVFMAAKIFIKQLEERDSSNKQKNVWVTVEEETPAQAEARVTASMKLHMEKLSRIWFWLRDFWLQNTKE